MRNFLYSWRYYSFGKERYQECISKLFINNLNSVRQLNTIVAILVGFFSLYPLVIERDFFKGSIYLGIAFIALLLSFFTNYKMQGALVSNFFIYMIQAVTYANIFIGINIGIWHSGNFDVAFMYILICSLTLFINPPVFNLCLVLTAIIIFLISSIIVKFGTSFTWTQDIINSMIAGFLSLFLNWQVSKLRIGLELSTNMLEDERNKYFDQSIIDELTKLKNRRDFTHTFQRYLSNYRTSDDWLCIALMDIDFFKYYNDHYGHPMGDDCLRSVGNVLNGLTEDMGVYSARVGGEEFALLWFEKDNAKVENVVSYITTKMNTLKIQHEKSKVAPYVTLSIGVYVARCGESNDTKALYNLADKALYIAKEGGRNCAVVYGNGIDQYKIVPKD